VRLTGTERGLTPTPSQRRRWMKEKAAWASESRYVKWWVEFRERVSQYPSHLTTREAEKRGPSSSIGAAEWADRWLGVHQWISSVLGTEKETPRFLPLSAMVVKSPWRQRMLPLCAAEATVMAKSST